MRIIDLTLPMYTGMPVYPGDAEASIELVQTLNKDGWNMRRMRINTHDGTHLNVPVHVFIGGKTLDDYSLEHFCGVARIYNPNRAMTSLEGIIFSEQNISQGIAEQIMEARPRFVGLSNKYEIDPEIERSLLREGVILYEHLVNTEQLPNEFMFYGMPLKIKGGDGSPVRAFAIVES